MLIHECTDCQTLSINRIAADDDPDTILAVFQESLWLEPHVERRCRENDIRMLDREYAESVRIQLFGRDVKVPALSLA